MKRSLAWLALACLLFSSLSGCSSNSGGNESPTGDLPLPAGKPAEVTLSIVANGSSYDLVAVVTDADGIRANDGTSVTFSSDNTSDKVLPNVVLTSGGEAQSSYTPASTTTSATITATVSGSISDSVSFQQVGPPANIVVTNGLPPTSSLSPGEQTTVTAYITDSEGLAVTDGTVVYFATTGVGATVTPASVGTADGFATVVFDSGLALGNVSTSASTAVSPMTGLNVSGSTTIPVTNGEAAAISFVSVSPESFIGVRGSGQNEFADLLFSVRDVGGNPVPDGTSIKFSLTLSLHGGEKLLSEEGHTVNGEVTATVQSGFVAGPLRVLAEYTTADGTKISTIGVVSVVSSVPDSNRLTVSQELFNQAGFRYEGLLNKFFASLADRYGNVVKDGTPVNFISDCGRIGLNQDGVNNVGAFTATTIDGKASAEFRTGNPVKELCSVLVYTPGVESFQDFNANGIFDTGIDVCTGDIGEPYLDENYSGSFNPGELYIDTNENSSYDGPNGLCEDNVLVWDTAPLMQTGSYGPINFEMYDSQAGTWGPTQSFALQHQEGATYRFTLQDFNGNALVDGTAFEITSNDVSCSILGDSSGTFDDTIGPGRTFQFSVFSNTIAGSSSSACTVTVTVTPPDSPDVDTATVDVGNNGGEFSFSVSGVVGLDQAAANPDDNIPPTVITTIPMNGDTQVLAESNITIIFSEAMDPLTVIPQYVTLTDLTEGTQRPTYLDPGTSGDTTYVFTPDGGFMAGHQYQVTVAGNVTDISGNAMGSPYSFSFTSIGSLGNPPRVIFTSPAHTATNVRNDASFVVRFNNGMTASTMTPNANVYLERVGGAVVPLVLTESLQFVPGQIDTFVFDPASITLQNNSQYRLTVSANVRDANGTPMDKDFTATFTTGTQPSPRLSIFSPSRDQVGVAVGANIVLTFNVAMIPQTIIGDTTVTLVDSLGATHALGTATVSGGNTIYTFNPGTDLNANDAYTLTVTTDVKAANGNNLSSEFSYTFYTAP